MQDENNRCALCKNVAKQKCGACQTVYYCSQDHQKSHWKIHSKNCLAFKLVENAQLGRHYVATRNIKVGETVLCEKAPLIRNPYTENFTRDRNCNNTINCDEVFPVCLSCYEPLETGNAKPCVKCGWPLCHKCTKHGTECEFTIKHRGSKVNISESEYGKPHPAYQIIGAIRALALRENDPKLYAKLMNLQDMPKVATQLNCKDSFSKAAGFAKTFFKIDDVEREEIQKIMRIILFNAQEVVSTKPPPAPHSAVYDTSSYIEHNCNPNCSKSFTDEGGIIMWAAIPISKGDHITMSYVNPLWGTMQRRKVLAASYFFECQCERCKDPTEFGMMISAIKCRIKECDGCMLPRTFLVSEENYPDFVCLKCSAKTPWTFVLINNGIVNIDWARVDKDNPTEFANFFAKWYKHFPENYFHILNVKIELACFDAFLGEELTERSDKSLKDLMDRCEKLTKVVGTLAHAENRIKGTLLYIQSRIHEVLFHRTFKEHEYEKWIEFMKEHKKMLKTIYLLLHREPTRSFENEILSTILDEIKNVESFP